MQLKQQCSWACPSDFSGKELYAELQRLVGSEPNLLSGSNHTAQCAAQFPAGKPGALTGTVLSAVMLCYDRHNNSWHGMQAMGSQWC